LDQRCGRKRGPKLKNQQNKKGNTGESEKAKKGVREREREKRGKKQKK